MAENSSSAKNKILHRKYKRNNPVLELGFLMSNPFMARAIALARKAGVEEHTGGCFGAVVVKDGVIVGGKYRYQYRTFEQ